MNTKGRVTIPTDMDAVPETLDLLKRWGADAIRDCDGTEFPQELKDTGAKIYATYYTTRKDNAWAKANPDETQQCYIMTPFYTAEDSALTIPLMTPGTNTILSTTACRGQRADHPPDDGHQPRADEGQRPRRHCPLVGSHRPHDGRAVGCRCVAL